ncbi:MAG: hypothetical protein MI808_16890 [Pseudomonadales bacterium]|nr:hypothetical protein [Pseudomonadales bacterium]
MKQFARTAFVCALLAGPSAALAAPVQYDFTGSWYYGGGNLLFKDQTISGSFYYDSDVEGYYDYGTGLIFNNPFTNLTMLLDGATITGESGTVLEDLGNELIGSFYGGIANSPNGNLSQYNVGKWELTEIYLEFNASTPLIVNEQLPESLSSDLYPPFYYDNPSILLHMALEDTTYNAFPLEVAFTLDSVTPVPLPAVGPFAFLFLVFSGIWARLKRS